MAPPEPRQLSTLTRTFLARFFENEAAGTTTDAREGFFWLIAALATPGIFLPLWMYFRWAAVAERSGMAALHRTLLFDKTIYLGVTTVGVSLLGAMVWHTLIVERRDALILGSLPVRGRTITFAKLAAMGAYIGMISLGMHGISALLYGFGLSSLESWSHLLRFTAGQVAGATALNLFVFASVIATQNLAIAILGPRRFSRVSSLLQMLVVAAGVGTLLLVPAMVSRVPSLTAAGVPADSAVMWMPTMWFLGVNEIVAGTSFAAMAPLAERALIATSVAISVALVAFPIAARRTMAAAVDGNMSAHGRGLGAVSIWLTRALAHTPHRRGALQFTMAALARTHQQRLILAVTIGVAVALVTPAVVMYFDGTNLNVWYYHRWTGRPLSLIAAPLLWNFVVVLGMRAAMAFPSEIQASWLFAVAPSPIFVGRNAARSLLILPGVALPLALAAFVWYPIWPWYYVTPALIACALGMLTVVDAALWGFVGIPCAKPLATQRSGVTSRWPVLLVFLYCYAYLFPDWQIAAMARGPGWWFMLIPPALIFAAIHRGSKSAAMANGLSGDPHGFLTLDLSVSAHQLRRSVPHA